MLTTIVVELVRGTRATGSLFQLVSRNRRRYGGYVVHASIVLLAIGIIGSSAYGTTKELPLAVGQTMHVPGYTLTYLSLKNTPHGHRERQLDRDDRVPEGARPLERHRCRPRYVNSSALGVSHEVGIHTNWLRGEDLYVILDQVVGQHRSTSRCS